MRNPITALKEYLAGHQVEVTVKVDYVNGKSATYKTIWQTRKSAEDVATIVRDWMNGSSSVDIEGDNPVVINLYKVTSTRVTAREL